MKVEIMGPGCPRCETTESNARQADPDDGNCQARRCERHSFYEIMFLLHCAINSSMDVFLNPVLWDRILRYGPLRPARPNTISKISVWIVFSSLEASMTRKRSGSSLASVR